MRTLIRELREARKRHSSAREHYKSVMARGKGTPIDPEEYPPMRGMEGPFRMKNGRVVYYDPREGKYYDRHQDMYLSQREANALDRR